MKRLMATGLLFCSVHAFAGPFCVVSGGGTDCNFFNVQHCQSSANTLGGMCVANQQSLQQSTYTPPAPRQNYELRPMVMPNLHEAALQGQRDGQRQRMEREQHEARMALLKAQTEAAQPRTGLATQTDGASIWADAAKSVEAERGKRAVIYSCDGRQTTYPAVGCVVIGFGD